MSYVHEDNIGRSGGNIDYVPSSNNDIRRQRHDSIGHKSYETSEGDGGAISSSITQSSSCDIENGQIERRNHVQIDKSQSWKDKYKHNKRRICMSLAIVSIVITIVTVTTIVVTLTTKQQQTANTSSTTNEEEDSNGSISSSDNINNINSSTITAITEDTNNTNIDEKIEQEEQEEQPTVINEEETITTTATTTGLNNNHQNVNEITPVIDDYVSRVCTISTVQHIDERPLCEDICNERQCCFTLTKEQELSSCWDDETKHFWCMEYQPCQLLNEYQITGFIDLSFEQQQRDEEDNKQQQQQERDPNHNINNSLTNVLSGTSTSNSNTTDTISIANICREEIIGSKENVNIDALQKCYDLCFSSSSSNNRQCCFSPIKEQNCQHMYPSIYCQEYLSCNILINYTKAEEEVIQDETNNNTSDKNITEDISNDEEEEEEEEEELIKLSDANDLCDYNTLVRGGDESIKKCQQICDIVPCCFTSDETRCDDIRNAECTDLLKCQNVFIIQQQTLQNEGNNLMNDEKEELLLDFENEEQQKLQKEQEQEQQEIMGAFTTSTSNINKTPEVSCQDLNLGIKGILSYKECYDSCNTGKCCYTTNTKELSCLKEQTLWCNQYIPYCTILNNIISPLLYDDHNNNEKQDNKNNIDESDNMSFLDGTSGTTLSSKYNTNSQNDIPTNEEIMMNGISGEITQSHDNDAETVTALVATPDAVKKHCATEVLFVGDNESICAHLCYDKICCFTDEGNRSCLYDSTKQCMEYTLCKNVKDSTSFSISYTSNAIGGNNKNELDMEHFGYNIQDICTLHNIQTSYGYNTCFNACLPAYCCVDPNHKVSVEEEQDNCTQELCEEFQLCQHVWFGIPPTDDETVIIQQGHHSSTSSSSEGRGTLSSSNNNSGDNNLYYYSSINDAPIINGDGTNDDVTTTLGSVTSSSYILTSTSPKDLCLDVNIQTPDGMLQCQQSCITGACCFAEDTKDSCLLKEPTMCMEYHICSTIIKGLNLHL